MGKLNYVARKTVGVKAGQVLSKDLRKRIPPGISARAAARDPTLEIDMSGKELTDEGFAQFIDDLVDCVKFRDQEHPDGAARLTELHLPHNRLTVNSLVRLTEVVTLSAGDLRELDLSHNEINIVTAEQKRVWQRFLEAFKGCYMLKKIDLGNNQLGPQGVEILARVYMQSELDFTEADAEQVIGKKSTCVVDIYDEVDVLSLRAGNENGNGSPDAARQENESPGKGKAAHPAKSVQPHHSTTKVPTQHELKHYACTRGLRSVPYIIVSNTSLTDGGAIHLASMVKEHRTPEQLLEFLPASKAIFLPEEQTLCNGIIWLPNAGLSLHAQRLLSMTKRLQATHASDADSESESFEAQETDDPHTEKESIVERRQIQKKMEIEHMRLTKRVRIETLKAEGVHSAEIWSTALKMMVISRALLLDDSHRAVEDASDSDAERFNNDSTSPDQANGSHECCLNELSAVLPTLTVASVLGPFHPSTQSFDVDFPMLPGPGRNGRAETSTSKNGTASAVDTDAAARVAKAPVQPRQPWRFGLDLDLWRKIIADAAGANGILSKEQQMLIVRYASDWDALAYELTIKGAEEHQQIWKFLDTVSCFTYSPSS